MSLRVNNFLGRDLSIPGSLLYDSEQGLWARWEQGRWALGLTEPALLMAGGLRQAEPLAEPGQEVAPGDMVLLALTGKLKYLTSPLAGVVDYPADMAAAAAAAAADPYAAPLMFLAAPQDAGRALADAPAYAQAVALSEGARNPSGAVGGASPTCKAVYQGIGAQRLDQGD
jgi:glycine cleavage system H lipoate-binding protein